MKKVFIGLGAGILLSGIACFVAIPGVQKDSYDKGYTAGETKGQTDGKAAGVDQGIAEEKAREKQVNDNNMAMAKKEAAEERRARKPRKVEEPVQNWHVIDGKITAPIQDASGS